VEATRPQDDNSNCSGVSFALDRGSLTGLDCPQRLGKSSQAEVTQGKLLKAQSRELHFDGRRHLSEKPTFRPGGK
jgi:hypothetical protein